VSVIEPCPEQAHLIMFGARRRAIQQGE